MTGVLAGRDVGVSEVEEYPPGIKYVRFNDPDGNPWALQKIPPGFKGECQMDNQEQLFTMGLWSVKEGKEAEFVRSWKEFAQWTSEHQPGASHAQLLQDLSAPNRFLSIGPWEQMEDIQTWRTSPEFAAFFGRARELCDEIRPHTLKLVAQVPA